MRKPCPSLDLFPFFGGFGVLFSRSSPFAEERPPSFSPTFFLTSAHYFLRTSFPTISPSLSPHNPSFFFSDALSLGPSFPIVDADMVLLVFPSPSPPIKDASYRWAHPDLSAACRRCAMFFMPEQVALPPAGFPFFYRSL